MIKKLTSILLVLSMLICTTAFAAGKGGGASVLSEDPGDPEPTETPAPTETHAPTPTPTPEPAETPTPEPTETPKPSNTPKPSDTPKPSPTPTQQPTQPPYAPTQQPTQPPFVPTQQPTQQPGTKLTFWSRAADTLQRVEVNKPFEIVLLEGVTDQLTFSTFFGTLPAGVSFVNDIAATRRCSIKGTLNSESRSEFAIEFLTASGTKLMVNFRLDAFAPEEDQPGAFPAAKPLVPFGGTKTAALPFYIKRKEGEEA